MTIRHGGNAAAQFVRDHLPKVIFEDAEFPSELEKVVTRSFMETDAALAQSWSVGSSQSSGTTAITAMIFGRYLDMNGENNCKIPEESRIMMIMIMTG